MFTRGDAAAAGTLGRTAASGRWPGRRGDLAAKLLPIWQLACSAAPPTPDLRLSTTPCSSATATAARGPKAGADGPILGNRLRRRRGDRRQRLLRRRAAGLRRAGAGPVMPTCVEPRRYHPAHHRRRGPASGWSGSARRARCLAGSCPAAPGRGGRAICPGWSCE